MSTALNIVFNSGASLSSKKEKRYKFEKDLIAFIEKAIKMLDTKVNYRFFNYILLCIFFDFIYLWIYNVN